MGTDFVIVNLTMSEETTRKRISKRHGESQSVTDMLMVKETKTICFDKYQGNLKKEVRSKDTLKDLPVPFF